MEIFEHKVTVKMEGQEEKTVMNLSVNMAGLDLEPFALRGLKDLAANSAKVVRDGTATPEQFIASFQETVEKYSRGETARKPGEKKATGVTPLIAAARDVLELGLIGKAGLDAASIGKAELKTIRAQVREEQKGNTAKWQWALARGEKELAARARKTQDMPD